MVGGIKDDPRVAPRIVHSENIISIHAVVVKEHTESPRAGPAPRIYGLVGVADRRYIAAQRAVHTAPGYTVRAVEKHMEQFCLGRRRILVLIKEHMGEFLPVFLTDPWIPHHQLERSYRKIAEFCKPLAPFFLIVGNDHIKEHVPPAGGVLEASDKRFIVAFTLLFLHIFRSGRTGAEFLGEYEIRCVGKRALAVICADNIFCQTPKCKEEFPVPRTHFFCCCSNRLASGADH